MLVDIGRYSSPRGPEDGKELAFVPFERLFAFAPRGASKLTQASEPRVAF